MRKRSPEQIEAIVRDKHAAGYIPADIAPFVGKPAAVVRAMLLDMGLSPHGGSPRPSKPNGRTIAEIDEYILDHAASEPSTIANILKMPTAEVRERMADLGLEVRENDWGARFHVHPMWTAYDDDDLREAIWNRQRDGAREALRASRLTEARAFA